DDAVAGDLFFVHAELGRPVFHEGVQLDEGSRVQEELDSFSSGPLALRTLGVRALLPATQFREGLPSAQLFDALIARHGRAERGGVSLSLRGGRDGRWAWAVASGEDLQVAFHELVFRTRVVHDDKGTVRRDVVRSARDRPLRGRRGDPLADRRALPAVILDQ